MHAHLIPHLTVGLGARAVPEAISTASRDPILLYRTMIIPAAILRETRALTTMHVHDRRDISGGHSVDTHLTLYLPW